MNDMTDLLANLLEEEEQLQFTQFTNEMAFEIGIRIIEKAKSVNKLITVDITRNGHQLFHCALPGMTADNDDWIKRKSRVVNQFEHSSYYMGVLFKSKGRTIQDYLLDSTKYTAVGGAFAIKIKNVGVVGTIAVSGLPPEEDHELITSVIREFI
jgi:uncharacterized protein (UPF0303 family)